MSEDKAKLNDCAEGRAFKEQVRQRVEIETKYEALGLRAVACKGWRWMSGMLGLSIQSSSRSIWIRVVDPPNDDTAECWPDFRDPATLGCLLALVREAWGASVYLLPDGGWYVKGARIENGSTINLGICATTEAEALLAALETAP